MLSRKTIRFFLETFRSRCLVDPISESLSKYHCWRKVSLKCLPFCCTLHFSWGLLKGGEKTPNICWATCIFGALSARWVTAIPKLSGQNRQTIYSAPDGAQVFYKQLLIPSSQRLYGSDTLQRESSVTQLKS